jgi:hypothetical protein
MMEDDPNLFDLATLRVDPERVRQPTRPKKWRRQFVRVPWHWVERLRDAKCISSYRLAMLLLYESWRLGGRPITLSNVSTLAEGLPRRTKWRALTELESLGLIKVRRRRRHAPRVVLRHLAREPS